MFNLRLCYISFDVFTGNIPRTMVVVTNVHLRQIWFVFVNFSTSMLFLRSIFNKYNFFCHPAIEVVLRHICIGSYRFTFFKTLNMPVIKTMSLRVSVYLLFQ